MTMWPQLTYLAFAALGVGYTFSKFGEVIPSEFMGVGAVIGRLLGRSAILAILYFGGFFAPLGFTP